MEPSSQCRRINEDSRGWRRRLHFFNFRRVIFGGFEKKRQHLELASELRWPVDPKLLFNWNIHPDFKYNDRWPYVRHVWRLFSLFWDCQWTTVAYAVTFSFLHLFQDSSVHRNYNNAQPVGSIGFTTNREQDPGPPFASRRQCWGFQAQGQCEAANKTASCTTCFSEKRGRQSVLQMVGNLVTLESPLGCRV